MDNTENKIISHMDYWYCAGIKPIVKFPFTWAGFDKLGLKGGYLASHALYYEGSVQGRTSDGGGYPWVIINMMNMERGTEDIDIRRGLITYLHGQEWKIADPAEGELDKISLSNFDSFIENLEPGKFYCLDTGKILDLEKAKKLSPDK